MLLSFLRTLGSSNWTEWAKIVKGHRKREMDKLRRCYLREKIVNTEMWDCQREHYLRENDEIRSLVRSTFPFRRALTSQKLLSNIRSRELFGYVEEDIRVPDHFKEKLSNVSTDFQKRVGFSLEYWWSHEKVCWRWQAVDSASKNANI